MKKHQNRFILIENKKQLSSVAFEAIVLQQIELTEGLNGVQIKGFSHQFIKASFVPRSLFVPRTKSEMEQVEQFKQLLHRMEKPNQTTAEKNKNAQDGRMIEQLIREKILSFTITIPSIRKNYLAVKKWLKANESHSAGYSEDTLSHVRTYLSFLDFYDVNRPSFVSKANEFKQFTNHAILSYYCRRHPDLILAQLPTEKTPVW